MKIEEGLIRELCLEASEVQKLLEINEKLVCSTPYFRLGLYLYPIYSTKLQNYPPEGRAGVSLAQN